MKAYGLWMQKLFLLKKGIQRSQGSMCKEKIDHLMMGEKNEQNFNPPRIGSGGLHHMPWNSIY